MAELRDKGIEIANEAVADDSAGRYEEAIQKYVKAAEWLLTATKYEKNPVTLKTLRDKCMEYTKRAEDLKKGLEATTKSRAGRPQSAGGGAGGDAAEDESDEDEPEPEPLTEEQLKAAEQEMEEELGKLVGMESVKKDMRRLCKELSLDLRRRQQGHKTLESIRHMMFTGNPGVGKTTVSRLVAKLYRQLGVSAKDHVVEVQKGDLVAGFVNQTAAKTAKHIKAARGGILFVDEAYQLTQAMSSGRHDFAGEAIDEMMKVMNDKGRKAVTFVFAGYKKEMDEFLQFNAGLESRIKYRFHFDDYTVDELVVIANLKMKAMGFKMTADAASSLGAIIDKGTTAELRSKYNGRLTDNLLQWASNEMNERLPLDATGDQLITLSKSDLEKASSRRDPLACDLPATSPDLPPSPPRPGDLEVHHGQAARQEGPDADWRQEGRGAAQELVAAALLRALRPRRLPRHLGPARAAGARRARARREPGRRRAPHDAARAGAARQPVRAGASDGRAVHRPRHGRREDVARDAPPGRVPQGLRATQDRLRGAGRHHVRRPQGDGHRRGGAEAQGLPRHHDVARRARPEEGNCDPRAHGYDGGAAGRRLQSVRRHDVPHQGAQSAAVAATLFEVLVVAAWAWVRAAGVW